ncbi:tryptophan 7-halogenase [Ruficoccus amylovorans]|uniref:Tryptophan 7-halogenase n=1 Tax=Ruficoccus amylovorans TaxID=1804625 RepID=A0A842HFS1_9BACT|nr:NAD(P)/FAD-dependent oxidoreductase [Ruficoccus amylovorans]MBC2594374.1 tryptophan 7-halogenase [Ruficoccus amylovorans]
MSATRYDCLVIGAGPAGSAAGTLLAQAGKRVLIVERAQYPRFHIGESLIPAANRVLRKMNAWERVEQAGFVRKEGAEFTCGAGALRVHNRFRDGLIPGLDYTYQVERSVFDRLLLERAVEAGCELRQPVEAKSARWTGGCWQVELAVDGSTETVEADWLVDAAGRGRWLGRQLGIPTDPIPLPKRFAVYNHFRGVARAPEPEGGNIIITRVPGGWFWSIPLDTERTSVGLVLIPGEDRTPPEELFHQRVAANPWMRKCMAQAETLDCFRVEADYSFVNRQFAGERWVMLGDAAGFIDPVFSSGVYLALESADLAVGEILRAAPGKGLGGRARGRYERELRGRMRVMLDLIDVYYDEKSFAVFMSPTNRFSLFAAVNAVVAGYTRMPFRLKWRYKLFLTIARLNRRWRIAPPLKLRS